MAAPDDLRRTPTGTRSLLRSECEWKQGESSDGVFYREGRNSGASRWSAAKSSGSREKIKTFLRKKGGKRCGSAAPPVGRRRMIVAAGRKTTPTGGKGLLCLPLVGKGKYR